MRKFYTTYVNYKRNNTYIQNHSYFQKQTSKIYIIYIDKCSLKEPIKRWSVVGHEEYQKWKSPHLIWLYCTSYVWDMNFFTTKKNYKTTLGSRSVWRLWCTSPGDWIWSVSCNGSGEVWEEVYDWNGDGGVEKILLSVSCVLRDFTVEEREDGLLGVEIVVGVDKVGTRPVSFYYEKDRFRIGDGHDWYDRG